MKNVSGVIKLWVDIGDDFFGKVCQFFLMAEKLLVSF